MRRQFFFSISSTRRDATTATLSDFVLSFPVIISRKFDSPRVLFVDNLFRFDIASKLSGLASETPINGKGVVIFKYPSDPTVVWFTFLLPFSLHAS
ncbi:hypothetical protein F2Q69_00027665 [Brassica cretica]|uniref:Uncharacterized protein n=1 Tax=Brassica cretica TaxID=69181 RepID=A0A8S9S3X1_BRACR|nr:hypothetical protein F2Q69_00027665 [Brassica cretica]